MRSGGQLIFAGAVLMIIAFVLLPAVVIGSLLRSGSDDARFLTPGQQSYESTEPGRVYLWHHYRTIFKGERFDRPRGIADGWQITIQNAAGEPLRFTADGSISMKRGSDARQSIGYVDLSAGSRGSVTVTGEGRSAVFSFGKSNLSSMFIRILGGASVGLVLGGAGVICLVLGIVRLADQRSQKRKARHASHRRARVMAAD